MSKKSIYYQVRYLRFKYGGNKLLNDALSKIIWFSFPVVYGDYVLPDVSRKLHADYIKNYRIYKACEDIIYSGYPSYMLTLTLNDDAFDLSSETFHRYIKDYLNTYFLKWYCFADYGAENGRLHYHIISCTCPGNIIRNDCGFLQVFQPWNYGFHTISPITSKNAIRYSKKAFTYASKANGDMFRSRGFGSKLFRSFSYPMSYLGLKSVCINLEQVEGF